MLDAGLLEELKSILRRDLKLGADAVIADDMALVGGDIDLDSLDILLVVSSIEKRFGIRIPSKAVGRSIFQSVETLSRFVQDNRETLASGGPVAGGSAAAVDWLRRLPHGPEFRFLTSVEHVTPGQSAGAAWRVDGTEVFFAGHFPGRPIVPGVLLAEGLAQLAGLCAADGEGTAAGMLAQMDLRFENAVVPPATIEMSANMAQAIGSLRRCDVIASVGGKVAARGSVTIRFD